MNAHSLIDRPDRSIESKFSQVWYFTRNVGIFDNYQLCPIPLTTKGCRYVSDTKSYLVDSPIPPVLMSSIKKSIPTTSDLRVSSRRDMEVGSESSVPIKFTAWSEVSEIACGN